MKSWNQDSGYTDDDKAFIFDLDKKEKYKVVDSTKAIWCGHGYGPVFAIHHDIRLKDNYFCGNESYYYHRNNPYYKYSKNIDDNKIYFNYKKL